MHLWLFEILYLATKKYNPKEILIESRIKNELHEIIKHLFNVLSEYCIQSKTFTCRKDFKVGFFGFGINI